MYRYVTQLDTNTNNYLDFVYLNFNMDILYFVKLILIVFYIHGCFSQSK